MNLSVLCLSLRAHARSVRQAARTSGLTYGKMLFCSAIIVRATFMIELIIPLICSTSYRLQLARE